MRTIRPAKLAQKEDFQMTALFAVPQYWQDGQIFPMRHPRRQSALLWFTGCRGHICTLDGREIEISRGSLLSIPQGQQYTITFLSHEGSPSTWLIEFCLADPEPFALTEEIEILLPSLTEGAAAQLIHAMAVEYARPARSYLKLRRDMYALLAILAKSEETHAIDHRGFGTIEKGIHYLQTDETQSLSIEEIAAMCYVTPAYFRRLFHAYAGVSPAKYRTARKMELAKALMSRSGMSIAEISEQLGFIDPSYFCRVFKKETGIPPSMYIKQCTE